MKLVRDGIPDIVAAKGETEPFRRVVDDAEHDRLLDAKFDEELSEWREDGNPEELADLLGIVRATAIRRGIGWPELMELEREKRERLGDYLDGTVWLAGEGGRVQVRGNGDLRYVASVAAAFEYARAHPDVWKISWNEGVDHVRLVRTDSEQHWSYAPLMGAVAEAMSARLAIDAGESVESECPNCGAVEPRVPYDIGSGPELSCAACEWCWGAKGQELKPLDLAELQRVRRDVVGGQRDDA